MERCRLAYEARENTTTSPDVAVRAYAAASGWEFVKRIQTTDGNSFFPTQSAVYLIRNGKHNEIIKQRRRLYVDFSSLSGYNQEKEICEHLAEHPHPLLVPYLGSFTFEGQEFLRFKYCAGHELTEHTREGNLLPSGTVEGIIRDLSGLLDHLHTNGVLYLDIKAKNILYENKPGGKPTLLDFGMARMSQESSVRSLLSTPQYMPPEWGEQYVASTSGEVFQLGVLWYELLHGKHPFSHYNKTPQTERSASGAAATTTAVQTAEQEPSRESELLTYALPNMYNTVNYSGSPEKHLPLLQRMLARNPEERPSCTEIMKTLGEEISGGETLEVGTSGGRK
jgi:serine/threonine protein kinase